MLRDIIRRIEQRVQRDEGNRGIKHLITGPILYEAASAALNFQNIGILTGFPLFPDEPQLESDGLAGALCLARTLKFIGKNPTILIDPNGVSCMRSLSDDQFKVTSNQSEELDSIISIERSGMSKDGKYYTMRGLDISSHLTQLDTAYMTSDRKTIGIGDGGNEAGMGNLQAEIEAHIPNGRLISSVVPSDFALVCSVSTWGGYGLSAAISLLSSTPLCFSQSSELEMAEKIANLGVRDGMTRQPGLTIDGLPWSATEEVIQDIS